MKRTVKNSLAILLIIFYAGAMAIAQEKKDTKQLKVIVENKDGTKVIIDTIFNSITKTDTITTGDGNFIFVTTKNGKAKWTVKEGQDLSAISEESLEQLKEGLDRDNLMDWTIAEKGSKGNVVYITENGPEYFKEGGKSYAMIVKTDDTDSSGDNTNYVIAKDGLVITIEGNDDEKVQEIGKLIESQLNTEKDSGSAKTSKKNEKK